MSILQKFGFLEKKVDFASADASHKDAEIAK
jgi:hypothetical protein